MNMMVKTAASLATSLLMATGLASAAPHSDNAAWQTRLGQILPLMGHRNWIVIVDSAYPLQTSPGVETLETNAGEFDVLRTVLKDIDHSIHVRSIVYTDAELAFVPEQDAPGVTAYRKELKEVLGNRPVQSMLHEQLLKEVEETGGNYHIVILKTTMAIPYTSVFLRLDCKYWSDSQEQRLREVMKQAGQK